MHLEVRQEREQIRNDDRQLEHAQRLESWLAITEAVISNNPSRIQTAREMHILMHTNKRFAGEILERRIRQLRTREKEEIKADLARLRKAVGRV